MEQTEKTQRAERKGYLDGFHIISEVFMKKEEFLAMTDKEFRSWLGKLSLEHRYADIKKVSKLRLDYKKLKIVKS